MEEIKIKTQKLKFISIVKAFAPSISVVIFFSLLSFIPAGTLSYWNGWLLIGIMDQIVSAMMGFMIYFH